MRLRDGIDKNIGNFTYVSDDVLITPFFTKEYCEYIINKFDNFGWEIDSNGNYDTHLCKLEDGALDCKDYLQAVEEKIEPELIKNWTDAIKNRLWSSARWPVPFGKKYSLEMDPPAPDLALHVDNAVWTFLVRLNDNYEGCKTVFPRQNITSDSLSVGQMVIFPSTPTHPHYVTPIESGEKYSFVGRLCNLEPRSDEFDNILNFVQ